MLVLNSIIYIIAIAGICLCLIVGKWSVRDRNWIKLVLVSGLLAMYVLLAYSASKVEVLLK